MVISRLANRKVFGGDACVISPVYFYQFDKNRVGVIVRWPDDLDLRHARNRLEKVATEKHPGSRREASSGEVGVNHSGVEEEAEEEEEEEGSARTVPWLRG